MIEEVPGIEEQEMQAVFGQGIGHWAPRAVLWWRLSAVEFGRLNLA